MTNTGMKGEQAGTILRAALLSLLNPSEANSKMMDSMGIAITDAEGNFVVLSKLVENVSDFYGRSNRNTKGRNPCKSGRY